MNFMRQSLSHLGLNQLWQTDGQNYDS